MKNDIEKFGGEVYKTYRIYWKKLDWIYFSLKKSDYKLDFFITI
jgi:hypothetical protein